MTGFRLATLFALAAVLVSCGIFETRIGDILEDPDGYDGKMVTIAGKVKASTNLAVVRYYVLDDGTGEIHVVTERALPKEGIEVRARGKVKKAFSIGSATFLVVVERS